jgi:hypothetical protein
MVDTGFEIVQVTEWNYVTSHVFKGSRIPSAPVKDGPAAMIVRCKACATQWTARQWSTGLKPGTFYRLRMSVQITCRNPACEQDHVVANSEVGA